MLHIQAAQGCFKREADGTCWIEEIAESKGATVMVHPGLIVPDVIKVGSTRT